MVPETIPPAVAAQPFAITATPALATTSSGFGWFAFNRGFFFARCAFVFAGRSFGKWVQVFVVAMLGRSLIAVKPMNHESE
ncbi:MAG: hypothetical protein MUF49_14395 [Oculatellaceae cyanobacterium Prado106]|nr:hypothetical protein [Oculatellaceae cyanobacterium Prado106]